MESQSLVRFSSHPRPFRVTECYCDNPECRCTEVFLTFTEVGPSGRSLKEPVSFSASVDVETWQEHSPPQRMPKVAAWVQEYLDQCPAERRAEFKASFSEAKRKARRKATFTIDRAEVLAGTLLPYNDILEDNSALSSGGNSYTFDVSYRGHEYLVEDQYCPNPNCDCQSAHLDFFEVVTLGAHRADVVQRFHARVTFAGRLVVEKLFSCDASEAEGALAAWWKKHPRSMRLLEAHYEEVKRIGQRSLDAGMMADSGRSHEAPAREPKRILRSDEVEGTGRVGRNSACPCGSGRKYKKCCMPKMAVPR